MARKKNATFVGVSVVDTARDASIYARTIANTAGDLALVLDKATGENGQTPIDHTGGAAALGCPLGIPITNQTINKSICLASGSPDGTYAVLVVPVYFVAGISSYRLEVDFISQSTTTIYEVRDSSWSVLVSAEMREDTTADIGTIYSSGPEFVMSTSAQWAYVIVYRPLTTAANGGFFDALLGWRLAPQYAAHASTGSLPPAGTAIGSPYGASATFSPATMAADAIDTGMVAATLPLDAYVLTRLNRQINTAWEYITGAKIPGNSTYQCATTWDASKASFTNEAVPQFPMSVTATSCVHYDCVRANAKVNFLGALSPAAPVTGPTKWVRYPTAQAASIIMARTRGYTPKFPNGATSKLACRVLALAYDLDSLAAWSATVATAAGSKTAAFTQIGATNWWISDLTAIPFLQETKSNFTLSLSHSAPGVLTQELILCGYALAFTA